MDDFWRILDDPIVNGTFWSLLKQDYLTWTGRMSAQILVYLFFSKKYITESILVINTLNSIAFCAFIIFSFKIVTKNKYKICSKDFIIYGFFFALMFTTTGFIGQLIWKTAAIQYFWGFSLIIILYYYFLIQNKKMVKTSFLSGLFIGLYNELFVIILLLFCIVYFVESKIGKKAINKGVLFFAIGCFVGGIILIAAPGNYIRMAEISNGNHHNYSILNQILHLYYSFKNSTWPKTNIIIWLFILFFILAITNNRNNKSRVLLYSITFLFSLLVITPVIYSYGLQIRLLLIYYIISFAAVFQQFCNHNSKLITNVYNLLKKSYLLFGIGLLCIMVIMANAYYSLYKFSQNRQQLLEKYHSKNIKNITIPVFELHGQKQPYGITFDQISCNTSDPNNQALAKYYGFNTVKANTC